MSLRARRPWVAIAGALAASVSLSLPAGALCSSPDDDVKTVVLALDGVPYRTLRAALEKGAFSDWPEPRRLISTFPSMTNVGFAAIFRPLGADRVPGYEVPHFNVEENRVRGKSLFKVKRNAMRWRSFLDQEKGGVAAHAVTYMRPRRTARVGLRRAEEKVIEDESDRLVLYVNGTDSLTHFRGDRGLLPFLLELDRSLEALEGRVMESQKKCLRLVLFSDHGNTEQKVRQIPGLRRHLRAHGFRWTSRLGSPGDVVAPTLGIVNYGALFSAQEEAASAARALASHPQIDLAAYLSGPAEITIAGSRGSSRVLYREDAAGRRLYSYRPEDGDVLELAAVAPEMATAGALDDDGFAATEAWVVHSAEAPFPNAPQRLADGLLGTYVVNAATVLFSIEPGYAWGRRAAHFGARFNGGLLEGTHGGLDHDSTVGFYLTNDPELDPGRPIAIERALEPLARVLSEREP